MKPQLLIFLLISLALFSGMVCLAVPEVVSPDLSGLISDSSVNRSVVAVSDSLSGFPSRLERMGRPELDKVISFRKIFWTILIILVSWVMINFIVRITSLLGERHPGKSIALKRLVPVIRIAGWTIITYIIIVGVLQPPVETVFAFFASVGVAVGFASQDLLKNIFGGLVILFDRPFHVGDKIEVGRYYGEVLEIGLRSTRIVTADDSVVAVPNGEMMNQPISNSNSGASNCQVVAEFFLPLGVDTGKARTIAVEAAQVSRYVYLNKPVVAVFFHEVNGPRTYIKMRLKAYVSDIRDEFAFKSDMTELVVREFQKEGILEEGW
jgi:MscS family membrane protein